MKSNHFQDVCRRIDQKKSLIEPFRPLSPSLLKRLREHFIVDWTYNSNAIEGNTMTLRETKMVLEDGLTIGGKSLIEHLEAINHKEAIEYVYELAQTQSIITERELKDIHSIVLRKIDHQNAGHYRNIQVRITGSKHTPPDAFQLPQIMHDFATKYLVHPQGHPIEQAAQAHFHFVSIHPFVDGNGRTARLLMNLILMKHGYPPTIILKNDRKKYYDALEKGHGGNLVDFMFFVARSLERSFGLYLEVIPELASRLLSMAEAEKISPYSKDYLGVMARRGVIPAFKVKRNWMIFKNDLDEYVQNQEKPNE